MPSSRFWSVGGERVGDARSVALHGGVDGAHGQAALEVRRANVGGGGKKPEHGEAESAEDEDEERDDDTEKEFAHEASDEYCGRWSG